MTLTPVEKIEILKGNIRNLFSVDNEEFDSITTIPELRQYIKTNLDPEIFIESMIVRVNREITDRGSRIAQNQKRCEDLEEFKKELLESAAKQP